MPRRPYPRLNASSSLIVAANRGSATGRAGAASGATSGSGGATISPSLPSPLFYGGVPPGVHGCTVLLGIPPCRAYRFCAANHHCLAPPGFPVLPPPPRQGWSPPVRLGIPGEAGSVPVAAEITACNRKPSGLAGGRTQRERVSGLHLLCQRRLSERSERAAVRHVKMRRPHQQRGRSAFSCGRVHGCMGARTGVAGSPGWLGALGLLGYMCMRVWGFNLGYCVVVVSPRMTNQVPREGPLPGKPGRNLAQVDPPTMAGKVPRGDPR